MTLTERQYALLMSLLQTIPKAFSTSEAEREEDAILLERSPIPTASSSPPRSSSPETAAAGETTVDLLPELPVVAHTPNGDIKLHSATEVSFKVNTVSLDLFGEKAVDVATLKSAGLIRFALNGTRANLKMLNDGSMEAELGIRSFRIVDTNYSRNTKWRDIVPASKHNKGSRDTGNGEKGADELTGFDATSRQTNQLMLSYSVSAGTERAAIANLTLDTPTLIFSLEPLFALSKFATSPFATVQAADQVEDAVTEGPTLNVEPPEEDASAANSGSSLAFRVNIVDARIFLLADPERSDSEAIILSLSQFEMVQQSILVLHTTKLGMALCKMDRPSERASFLDEINLTLSMDNRAVADGKNTSIEVEVQPIVLRVSFRDVMLAKAIVNRAIELSSSQTPTSSEQKRNSMPAHTPARTQGRVTSSAVSKPKVIMARENVLSLRLVEIN